MCHSSVLPFFSRALSGRTLNRCRILEVGSRNYNGSIRCVLPESPSVDYVGVDIQSGPGVDIVCDAIDLDKKFEPNSFDIILSSETLEHVCDWRKVVANLKSRLKVGGLLILSTRSYGMPYHGFPHDYWRFELSDFEQMFGDMEILSLEKDPLLPGVFLEAVKGLETGNASMLELDLYSIILGRRVRNFENKHLKNKNFLTIRFKQKIIRSLNRMIARLQVV